MGIPKNSKQQHQHWYRELIPTIIQLVQQNDHNSLALIARNSGIPPQLRHIVWPILLKYHPFVIAPSILSNTLIHEKSEERWVYEAESRTDEEVEAAIVHDLNKYFLNKHSEPRVPLPDIAHYIQFLRRTIVRFLEKWSRIFKYEAVLSWIAVGLAEWVPIDTVFGEEDAQTEGGSELNRIPISNPRFDKVPVLQGKRHHITIQSLYKEYPLPSELSSRLPRPFFKFYEIYERLVLVILHCPDMTRIKTTTESDHVLPFISGCDISTRTQLFFKVFQLILPELYQPFTDEETLQSSRKADWLYWWFKSCGSKVMHKQDRAHLWDVLLGWRPHPSCLRFYLNYNNKSFCHLYNTRVKLDQQFLKKVCKDGNDPFWFPDLDLLPLGTPGLEADYQVMKELIRRNKYDHAQLNGSANTLLETHQDTNSRNYETKQDIPFSLIDPHIQLLFIYIAILQQNEFKLLEFEEAEIAEFLSKVPLLSKTDDYNFKRLYDDDATSMSSTDTEDSQNSSSRPSTSSHMLIEVGTDDKVANSFDDISQLAGDIWRKWMWLEFEEHQDSV
ncbi:HFR035Cp [Eremothecium sinecaudum]|uniref:HFR035Cp n=1 Tax=Eremothecium sinecaudum TaxID=45286 RepID=A0A0X8HUZ8_9SACH|nr:HFR035Cp [Eremothecium sinecaudum]AMD21890.1 HFR035Cp [Eremothecium sinecaudum]